MNKQISFILLVFLSLVEVYGILAQPAQEDLLQKAKQLITEQDYDKALLVLVQIVREDPEKLYEAQVLISQIQAIRDQYNQDYTALVRLLYEKEDEQSALEVIKKMEALDKNPNQETKRRLQLAKRSASLIYSRKRFNQIMAQALEQLKVQNYSQAVQIYLTGYVLHRSEFDENDYGSDIKSKVEKALADLKSTALAFVEQEQELKRLKNLGISLIGGGGDSIKDLLAPMKNLAALRHQINQDAETFVLQNQAISKKGMIEDLFLGYSFLFTRGREKSGEVEGIIGVIDRLWNEFQDAWLPLIRQKIDESFNQARQLLADGNWNQARQGFSQCRLLITKGLDVVSLWNLLAYPQTDGRLNEDWITRIADIVPLVDFLETRATLIDQTLQAISYRMTSQDFVKNLTLSQQVLGKASLTVKEQKSHFTDFTLKVQQMQNRQEALLGSNWKVYDPSAFLNFWKTLWQTYHRETLNDEIALVDRLGKKEFQSLQNRYHSLEKQMNEVQALLAGTVASSQAGDILLRYPFEARQSLEATLDEQKKLPKDAQDFIAFYEDQQPEVKVAEVANFPSKGRELLARYQKVQSQLAAFLPLARENYNRSLEFKKRGQDKIPKIEQAIASENFSQARELLAEVSSFYTQSLNWQEDPKFRQLADRQVSQFAQTINSKEQVLVVNDVRRLLTQGSGAYLSGQYSVAEQLLLRAKSRWAVTNLEANTEVNYWLNLVNFALSVSTGRVVNTTDPLYNEIQQLLNFARNDREVALAFLQQGKEDEAKNFFDRAKQTIGKVLIPFPVNQEARVLNLLIQKDTNPRIFSRLFQDSFDTALRKLPTNPNETYNDLQDLEEIQPGYPGLSEAIYRTKVALRIIPPRPNPADLRESRSLTTLAKRIYNAQKIDQFSTALEQLSKALEKDPNNTEAQELKDQMSLSVPNRGATMSVSENRDFDAIIQLYSSGRTLEARAKLNFFIQAYPNLKNNPQVKRLERRLQAAI